MPQRHADAERMGDVGRLLVLADLVAVGPRREADGVLQQFEIHGPDNVSETGEDRRDFGKSHEIKHHAGESPAYVFDDDQRGLNLAAANDDADAAHRRESHGVNGFQYAFDGVFRQSAGNNVGGQGIGPDDDRQRLGGRRRRGGRAPG